MLGGINVKIATDLMSAEACITDGDEVITEEYIMSELKAAGVTGGIDKDMVTLLSVCRVPGEWYTVAKGRQPGESIPGYYDYFFEVRSWEEHVTIDDNGKVHFGKQRALCEKGDRLCLYHHPVTGAFGFTVVSSVIAPTPVTTTVHTLGEGVEKIGDEIFATHDGEVMVVNNEILVKNVLIISGNAKYAIDSETEFNGDVHIYGDVLTGVNINARGSVEVEGTVESAMIIAGKDIIVHGGIQGDDLAELQAGGSIICPFVEGASLFAQNDITCDYVMRSNLRSGRDITIKGRHGEIIGGTAIAVNSIDVNEVGSDIGVATKLVIDNPSMREVENSKITIRRYVNENCLLDINGIKFKNNIIPDYEYHLVNGEIKRYRIGEYMSLKDLMPELQEQVKKTILLVDDEPMILKTFFNFLRDFYNVQIASSASDAKLLLNKMGKVPDLILLDYQMPGMTGAEFLASIRRTTWKHYTNVPVIFVTAMNDRETISECLNLYPQGYLVKPLSQDDLLGAVRNFFYK